MPQMDSASKDANINDMGRKLEEALLASAKDPEARPDFYKMLLNAQVYVAGRMEPAPSGEAGAKPHLQLKHWKQSDGALAMPFFATLESFRDMFGFSEAHFLMPALDLFRFSSPETVLVLTSIDGAKEFKRDEVEMLLSLVMDDPLTLALERALQNADENMKLPLWDDFYSALVKSRVFAVAKPAGADEKVTGPRMVKDGESFSLAAWTHPDIEGAVAPFFSSPKILNQCVPAGESYLALPALDFLKMAAGFERPLVLNPGYKFFKFFAPQEVRDILAAAERSVESNA